MFEAPAHFFDNNKKRPGRKWGEPRVWPMRPNAVALNDDAIFRMDDITQATMEVTGFSKVDLLGRYRRADLVHARHAAWYLCRTHCLVSFPQIGRHWKKDHTSILHGVQTVTSNYDKFRGLIDLIRSRLATEYRGKRGPRA